MMPRDYGEVLRLATELQFMTGYLDTHQLNERAKIERSFRSNANRLAYELLRDFPDPDDAVLEVERDLDALAASNDPPLEGALVETRTYLLERIARESRRSPRLRTIIRWTPAAIGVVAVIAYFSVRQFSLLDIDAPAQSREGMVQRAAAFEKVRNHTPRSGYSLRGAALNILMWPIEPTEEEIAAAREFFSMNEETFARLSRQGQICLDPGLHSGGLDPRQLIELVRQAAAYVREPGAQWAEPPIATLAAPIRRALPCR